MLKNLEHLLEGLMDPAMVLENLREQKKRREVHLRLEQTQSGASSVESEPRSANIGTLHSIEGHKDC